MNSKKILGLLIITLLLFFNCSNNDNLASDDIIVYQEDNVKITLTDLSDYRCPINLDCIWEGNAEVGLRINSGIATEDFILNTLGRDEYPANISVFGLEIELLDVQPLPEEGVTYTLEDYTISISVTD